MQEQVKVVTILGTRPEIIRLSSIINLLDHCTNHILIHTGQNYDPRLNEIFFQELNLRKPDYYLNAAGDNFAESISLILKEIYKKLIEIKPDAVLILGDTNSSLSGYVAKRLHIPVYHMEAGNRCFDQNVPEETNRKIIDHISDFNLVYTEHARRNLLSEGYPARRIYLTGSPLNEVIRNFQGEIENSTIHSKLEINKNDYIVVSLHREENVDNPIRLKGLINSISFSSDYFNKRVIFSTHPRTRKRLLNLSQQNNFLFSEPFGYFDYLSLQKNAFCVISDSGTISEESAILGFPAITLRKTIERPEAMDSGHIILSDADNKNMVNAIQYRTYAHNNNLTSILPQEYKITDCSFRVVTLIIGTCKLSNQWDGIEERINL